MKFNIKTQVYVAISTLAILIGIGTITFRILEDWTWIQSFYFAVTTLSTVGYGDIHPTTDRSRLFAAVFILFGVTVAIGSISIIGSNYIARREQKLIQRQDNATLKK